MLASQPVVPLGEVHDDTVQHALRARALRALVESGARPALLMGLPTHRCRAGPWPLYRPYVALALEYRLPLVAANMSRVDTRRIAADGLAVHGFEARVPDDLAAG